MTTISIHQHLGALGFFDRVVSPGVDCRVRRNRRDALSGILSRLRHAFSDIFRRSTWGDIGLPGLKAASTPYQGDDDTWQPALRAVKTAPQEPDEVRVAIRQLRQVWQADTKTSLENEAFAALDASNIKPSVLRLQAVWDAFTKSGDENEAFRALCDAAFEYHE